MKRKCLVNPKGSICLLAFIFMLYSMVYMTKHCYSAAMTTLIYEKVLTKSQTGLINAIFYIIYAPVQVIGGRMADKYRPDKLIAAGVFGSGAANLIIYLNQNYYVMLATWGINAVFQAVIYPAVFKIMSSDLAAIHKEKGVFALSLTPYIGPFLAYFVAMFVRKWQENFLISAIVLFVLALLILIIYPQMEKCMIPGQITLQQDYGTLPDKYDAGLSNHMLFRKSGLYALVVIQILYGIMFALKTFASVVLMESYEKVSPFVGNFFFLFTMVAAVVGSLGAKALYTRFIKTEISAQLISVYLIFPCLIVLLFLGKIPVWAALFALISMSMITGLQFTTCYVAMRFARFGKNGEVAGIINCAAAVSLVIVNFGIAVVADHFGWIAVTVLGLFMAALALILLLWMQPRWKRFMKEYELE